jgi:putative membrane protein
MTIHALPPLNALLNGTSALLLTTGWVLIRRGDRDRHRQVMTAAFACSTLFLVSYLTYHAVAGTTRFGGTGTIRAVYFGLLGVHTLLAALVAPLAVTVFVLGRRARLSAHKRLARWVLPLWLTVSVTGVAVYLFLRPYYPRG